MPRFRTRRNALLLGGAAVALTALAADARELVIYTANYRISDALVAAYQAKNPDLRIDSIDGSTGPIAERAIAEMANPQADVAYLINNATLERMKDAGVFEPHMPETSAIPAEFVDPDGFYANFMINSMVMLVNTDRLAERGLPMPTSWESLLNPAYEDEITIASPARSGTGYTIYTTLLDAFGWNYIDNLHPNVFAYNDGGGAAGQQAGAGEIAVDLFGHPADYDRLLPIAQAHGLWLMDDAAQGFGATYRGTTLGTFGDFTATSFFPAKPLGCYGDGGAVFFEDDALVEVLTSLRVHGQGQDKYDNVRIGMNGRMDTIQCAVVLEKLKIFDDEIDARNRIAQRYTEGLADVAKVPTVAPGCTSIWAQYTLVLPHGTDRAAVQARLSAAGIPTAVYYGKAMHHQTAYARFPVAGNGLPVAEDYAGRVISLPMHAYLAKADQDRIVAAVREAVQQAA